MTMPDPHEQLVERVARAICQRWVHDTFMLSVSGEDRLTDEHWPEYRDEAEIYVDAILSSPLIQIKDVRVPEAPGSTRSAPEAPTGLRPPGDDPSRYKTVCEPMHPDEEGWSEWIHPLPGYLMQCCGCELIHEMEFAITARSDDAPLNEGESDETGVIVFRARRTQDDPGRDARREGLRRMVALDEEMGLYDCDSDGSASAARPGTGLDPKDDSAVAKPIAHPTPTPSDGELYTLLPRRFRLVWRRKPRDKT